MEIVSEKICETKDIKGKAKVVDEKVKSDHSSLERKEKKKGRKYRFKS